MEEVEKQALSDLVPLLEKKGDAKEEILPTLTESGASAEKIESGASTENDEVDGVPEQPFDEQEFMNYVIKLVI